MNLRHFARLQAVAAICAVCFSTIAHAQSGGLIIDRHRVDRAPLQDSPSAKPPAQAKAPAALPPAANVAAPADMADQRFILRELRIDGASSLDRDKLAALTRPLVGQTVSVRDIYAVANRIAAFYAESGLALTAVAVPRQDFADGVARIVAVEGSVRRVLIAGDTENADLDLIAAYGEKITNDTPLTRATLERYLLLMNDLPGITVGSSFLPVEGAPAVDLLLSVQRKSIDGNVAFNNRGSPRLGRIQMDADVTANALLQQGDSTTLSLGLPANLEKYYYVALRHQQPIGTEGTTVAITGGYLRTMPDDPSPQGRAYSLGLQVNHPFIRSLRENLQGIASLDGLNSDDALLGETITTERVRAARGGLAYNLQDRLLGDDFKGLSAASLVISQGIDGLGARQSAGAASDLDFTKLGLQLAREQDLTKDFALRARAAAQYSASPLPTSEQFGFGGAQFGRAFQPAELQGDRGVAFSIEPAWRADAPLWDDKLKLAELYGFYDWADLDNAGGNPLPAKSAASAGLGVRIGVWNLAMLEIEAALPVSRPAFNEGENDWRLFVTLTAAY